MPEVGLAHSIKAGTNMKKKNIYRYQNYAYVEFMTSDNEQQFYITGE